MRVSLRYRLLGPLLVLLAADAAGTGWAAMTAARAADRRVLEQLQAVGRTLAEPPTFPLTPRVLEQMRGLSGAEFLLVLPDGRQLSTFSGSGRLTEPTPAPNSDSSTLGPVAEVRGRAFRFLQLQLRPPHPNEGGTLYVFYPEDLRRSAVWDAARPPIVLGIVGGLAAIGLMLTAGRRLVGRVRDLGDRTRAIAGGDFRSFPVPRAGSWQDDEIVDLARSVNEMADRLAASEAALRATERLRVLGQFSGGLAHQLRNAAAGARLAIELHAIECPADPESLGVALRQLTRMETNLRQFLDLGKPPTGVREPCDLREVVGSAVELLRPQCRHAETELRWEPARDAKFVGDAEQLGHLAGNLIGNAVEAAGPGGVVEARLFADGPGWVLEVSDTGPGPPAAIADRLFDPFVTGRDQGVGLGLVVAKQAAEAHGGRIAWERRDGRTVFRAELGRSHP